MTKIGTDEWVAQVGERTEAYRGLTAPVRRTWNGIPLGWRFAAAMLLVALLPVATDSSYVVRVGVNAFLFGLLALGLNVVVGYAGLLDLGYIAFYGFGAYTYALLSSDQIGVHLPAELTLIVVVALTAGLGYVLGLPSRRLLGDYLAIVTLFFGQVFVQLAIHLDRLSLPWADGPVNVTGGPNGIVGIDPIRLVGVTFSSVTDYFYLLLVAFVALAVGLHRLTASRTGRAWRALREDPLAAEQMGLPVNRLKLLAFAVGGAVAGFAGAVFAAVQVGVFPQNFETLLLIMIYAAVILGGAGSLPGVAIGAAVIAVFPEVLRTPDYARLIFYGVVLGGLVALLRPWSRLAAVLAGTVVLGFVVRFATAAAWPDAAAVAPGGLVARALGAWVATPPNATTVGNVAFVLLVPAVLAVTRLRGPARTWALPTVLYLAAFVWETRLVAEPSVTRQLVLGAILVVMMTARPQGLLGTPRVEML
ncbi:hypothetical protein BH23ACT7_BH23ACT7_02510 [soil metagenome]